MLPKPSQFAPQENGGVGFNYNDWHAVFSSYNVNQTTAEFYFQLACGIVANPNADIPNQSLQPILYLLVAHYAELFGQGPDDENGSEGGLQGGAVGRVSDAEVGSVSVRTEMESLPGSRQWFEQTQAGFTAYQLLLPWALDHSGDALVNPRQHWMPV